MEYMNGLLQSKAIDADYLRVASIWGYINSHPHLSLVSMAEGEFLQHPYIIYLASCELDFLPE